LRFRCARTVIATTIRIVLASVRKRPRGGAHPGRTFYGGMGKAVWSRTCWERRQYRADHVQVGAGRRTLLMAGNAGSSSTIALREAAYDPARDLVPVAK